MPFLITAPTPQPTTRVPRIFLRLGIISLGMFYPVLSLAQTGIAPSPLPATPLQTLLAADNEVGIAAVGTLQNYQEALPSPSDTESGWMPGFRFELSGINPVLPSSASLVYFSVRYQYNSGNLNYQGFSLATHQPVSTTDAATLQQVSVRIGKGFQLGSRGLLIPYFQYRFQDWERSLQNAIGQREHYESNSAGVGLLGQWTPAHRWVLTGDLAWADGFSGTVHGTHGILSPVLPLHPGSTLQAGLTADYRFQGPWHLFAGLKFVHYSYAGSPPFYGYVPSAHALAGPLREPGSQTNLFSALFGVAYHF